MFPECDGLSPESPGEVRRLSRTRPIHRLSRDQRDFWNSLVFAHRPNGASQADWAAAPLTLLSPDAIHARQLIRRANQQKLASPLCKNISVFPKSKSGYVIGYPVPLRGALASVTNAGRVAVDAAASGVTRDGRAGFQSVSGRRHADERCCCVRQNRVVPAPVAGVKFAEARRPNRDSAFHIRE